MCLTFVFCLSFLFFRLYVRFNATKKQGKSMLIEAMKVLIFFLPNLMPGAIARSVAMSLGNQEAGTIFREDLVMKIFLRPYFLFH